MPANPQRAHHFRHVNADLSDASKHELRFRFAKGIPYEVGGLIYEDGRVVQYDNTFKGDKRHGFEFDCEPEGDVAAIWHTHPTGPESISSDDMSAMMQLSDLGLHHPWIVVSPNAIMAYRCYDPAIT